MTVEELTAIEKYIGNLREELDKTFGIDKSTWINLSISREELAKKFSIAISSAIIKTIKEASHE